MGSSMIASSQARPGTVGIVAAVLTCLATLAVPGLSGSPPLEGEDWILRADPDFDTENDMHLHLTGAAYGNGVYVAVGGAHHGEPSDPLFWSDFYVAISYGNPSLIAVSSDLDDWTWHTGDPSSDTLRDVAFGNGTFLAVGSNGSILRSPDGTDWKEVQSPHLLSQSPLRKITYANDHFVVINGDGAILFSRCGEFWKNLQSSTSEISAVSSNEERFVVAGAGPEIVYSDNLHDWNEAEVAALTGPSRITDIAHGADGFVGVGYQFDSSDPRDHIPVIFTSPDGKDWHEHRLDSEYFLTGVTYADGRYVVAGGYPEKPPILLVSDDAETWTEAAFSGDTPVLFGLAATREHAVGVGEGGAIVSAPLQFPVITDQPRHPVATENDPVTLTVDSHTPAALDDLSFEWRKEGEPLTDTGRITGSDAPSLVFSEAELSDGGRYTVRVTNDAGTVESAPIDLVVRKRIRVAHDFSEATEGWGERAFAGIQAAIDSVDDGETAKIIVEPGIYNPVDFLGRDILLTGTAPYDRATVVSTVIDGSDESVVVNLSGSGPLAGLQGFTVRNGNAIKPGGIAAVHSAALIANNRIVENQGVAAGIAVRHTYRGGGFVRYPAIVNNIIAGNRTTKGGEGGGLHVFNAFPEVRNNVFADNTAGHFGGGVYFGAVTLGFSSFYFGYSLRNNVFANNTAASGSAIYSHRYTLEIGNSIVTGSREGHAVYTREGEVEVTYSNFWNNEGGDFSTPEYPLGKNGNISTPSLFADPKNEDYRLRSRVGRWDPRAHEGQGAWVTDESHSPSIAAGNPESENFREPESNGGRINMGAYGNTSEASRSFDDPALFLTAHPEPYLPKSADTPVTILAHRTGPQEPELALITAFSGGAREGEDFTLGGGFDALPSRQVTASLNLRALETDQIRGDRNLVLLVEENDAFVFGDTGSVEVLVADHPYRSWLARHFAEESWSDDSVVAPLADPDGNGIVNLIRFAVGGDGGSSGRPNMPVPGVRTVDLDGSEADYPTLSFDRLKRGEGIDYIIEASNDLQAWDSIPTHAIEITDRADGVRERVTVRDEIPVSESRAHRFLRVRIRMDASQAP